jgi:hypothetical protein
VAETLTLEAGEDGASIGSSRAADKKPATRNTTAAMYAF